MAVLPFQSGFSHFFSHILRGSFKSAQNAHLLSVEPVGPLARKNEDQTFALCQRVQPAQRAKPLNLKPLFIIFGRCFREILEDD